MPRQTRRTGRYGLLLLATVLSVAVQGTVDPGAVQQVVVTGLAGACLLLAFRAANLKPRLIQIASALAVAALAVALVRATAGGIGEGAARCMNAALVALGPPAVAVGVVRDLRTTGLVRLEAVFGVLSLYILVGMAFGFVYGAIDQLGGDPFFAGGQAPRSRIASTSASRRLRPSATATSWPAPTSGTRWRCPRRSSARSTS